MLRGFCTLVMLSRPLALRSPVAPLHSKRRTTTAFVRPRKMHAAASLDIMPETPMSSTRRFVTLAKLSPFWPPAGGLPEKRCLSPGSLRTVTLDTVTPVMLFSHASPATGTAVERPKTTSPPENGRLKMLSRSPYSPDLPTLRISSRVNEQSQQRRAGGSTSHTRQIPAPTSY